MSNWTSNAFNFDSFCSGGVDQRTRSYSYQILFGSLIGNWLKGPNLDISIQFSPYSTDNLGFGKGWKLNLPRYDIENQQLYLANGQSYRAELNANIEMSIRYKKLLDFSVSSSANGYEITYKNGRTDLLDKDGDIIKITQSNGHALYFSWLNVGQNKRLDKVWDDRTTKQTALLWVEYISVGRVNIFTNIGSTHEAYFSLTLSNNKLVKCNLPEQAGSYSFGYESIGSYTLINEVNHPCGLTERLRYKADGIRVNSMTYLPAVTAHDVLTLNSPVITTTYDSVGTDSRNFMGYGVRGGELSEGLDNLLERGYEYTYRVQKIENGSIVTAQTYNQFHLLVEEARQVNGDLVHLKRLEYPAIDNQQFSAQPAQYSLISEEEQVWFSGSDSQAQSRLWDYDEYGNMLKFVDENDIAERYEYYAKNGEEGCPASPTGMVNFVKSRTLNNGSEQRVISYQYASLEGLNGHRDVVLSLEEDVQRYRSHYAYQTDTGETYSFGRLASVQNDILHPNGTYSAISHYRYELDSDVLEEHEELTCHDNTKTNLAVGHYLDIGELARHVDSDGVSCAFTYDSLRRTTEERIEGSAARSYQYIVDTGMSRQTLLLTDCKGNLCEQSWDGQGRELEAKVGSSIVWTKMYDALGRLQSKSTYDVLPDRNSRSAPVVLTESYEYDEWDQVKATLLANGKRRVEFNNLASRKKTQGIEGLTMTVSSLNSWGLEEKKEQGINSWNYEYDSWGRLIKETNPLARSKHYHYDRFDRVIRMTQANGVDQDITYAEHTDQSQVVDLKIGGVTLGQRDIDGLGRPRSLRRGASPQASLAWTYADSSNIPETETSMAAPTRLFARDSQLGVLSAKSSDGQASSYSHDPISGLPTGSQDSEGNQSTITYSTKGLPEAEVNDGQSRYYSYSDGGVIAAIDSDTDTRQYGYDELGRLVKLSSNSTTVYYEYDEFDRVILETLISGSQTQVTELEWDEYSREVNRAIALNDNYIFEQSQEYNALGLLNSRKKECATLGNLTEIYTYDDLSPLTKVEFFGAGPLSDWSQPMTSIDWSYDELGNMLTQRTATAESEDFARYFYESDDPCQLTRITHSHPQLDGQVTVKYDLNGNMIQDADGRILEYDHFDRLQRVLADNTEWLYQYDSNDRLSTQQSVSESRHFNYLWGDLASIEENGKLTQYIYHEGVPKWSEMDSETTLLATDQNGSVIASNTSGKTGSMYRYSPYGQRDQAGNANEQ
ncbi:RHS repeat protein [Vibrio splendidus]|uniref:RHS repeat protein n=1 Tax=Vibrio splendidus TaxID=29497 RepID=UPI000C855CD0|nr:RHS repeat protein [Vibrio splendidus]PMI52296.1 sugar-binding protein [Vibrio splendidus]